METTHTTVWLLILCDHRAEWVAGVFGSLDAAERAASEQEVNGARVEQWSVQQ